MKKYALLIALCLCLTSPANAEKNSDKIFKAFLDISEEVSKCATMYTMLSASLEKTGAGVEEIEEYKRKAVESLYIAKTIGATVGRNEDEVLENLMGYHPILTRLAQDDNGGLQDVIRKCLVMSADYKGFIKNKLGSVGLPEELIENF